MPPVSRKKFHLQQRVSQGKRRTKGDRVQALITATSSYPSAHTRIQLNHPLGWRAVFSSSQVNFLNPDVEDSRYLQKRW